MTRRPTTVVVYPKFMHTRRARRHPFLVMFDGAVVKVAQPSIQRDLGFSASSLQWGYSAYALAFGGRLLVGGRIADIIGRRKMFVIGAGY